MALDVDALLAARPDHRVDRIRLTEGGSNIEINGVDLRELVRAVERPLAHAEALAVGRDPAEHDIAGTYAGLSVAGVQASLAADLHQLDPERPKATLLACECGNLGCWDLLVRVTRTADYVVWSDFEQAHRPWVYDLGPFVFERDQYASAISPVDCRPD